MLFALGSFRINFYEPIEAHLANMSQLGTWGTQVEIIAAATQYHTPVYIAQMESLINERITTITYN